MLACAIALWGDARGALPDPRERIDFWQRTFTEVRADADPRVARAQDIFARLVRIAGTRPGIEPRLHVIGESPALSLPIALPDGWVVISRDVIEFCYRVPGHGDDRLAFVLAHEISHVLEDDFWHAKFFQVLEAYRTGSDDQQVLSELRGIAAFADQVLAKELRADELGITYIAMAGFDPRAVLGEDGRDDFFQTWLALLDPGRLGAVAAPTHPQPAQRATTVKARLRQVVQQSELFELGQWFYHAGDYPRAIQAFEEFRRYFPGREVHHNLGVAHHRLALSLGWPELQAPESTLLKMSVTVDTRSRARRRAAQSSADAARALDRHLAAAIDHYRVALSQDGTYLPVYRNLGAAYVLRDEPYKAIAVLTDALKLAPRDPDVLNNLGAAFVHVGNLTEARGYLDRARAADPHFDAPLFNLAVLAHRKGDAGEAQRYAALYLQRDAGTAWADVARHRYADRAQSPEPPVATWSEPESLVGLEIGAYDDEVPAGWGAPDVQAFDLGGTAIRLARYANGLVSVSQGDEIRWLVATAAYTGTSRREVRIGQTRAEVEARYGAPAEVLASTVGYSLAYPAQGVTFALQDGRVSSWLLYWD